MKNYKVTVNGTVYNVSVEEGTVVAASAASAPAAAPAAAPAPATAPAAAPAGEAGANKITAGAAGKVFKIEKKVGDAVKKGDSVVVVEAMKMEIPMVAPVDGVVASIDCTVGDSVEAGALLATVK